MLCYGLTISLAEWMGCQCDLNELKTAFRIMKIFAEVLSVKVYATGEKVYFPWLHWVKQHKEV